MSVQFHLVSIRQMMRGIRARARDAEYGDIEKIEDVIRDLEADVEQCREHLEAALKERQSNETN